MCDAYPDALLKVNERWIGWEWYGTLCNHWVKEPERDKDVPNQHNPHALSWSNALHHRMCVFARAFVQMSKSDKGNRKCASVFWVCLLSVLVVSESVVPVCHCLKGLWVLLLFSSPVCSVSRPSPGSSSTPALCSSHRAGHSVPKQLKATRVVHVVFVSLFRSSSIISLTCSFFPKLKQR